MTGTFINVAAILAGGALGLLFGSRLPQRTRQTIVSGLGLFTAAIGFQMAAEMQQFLVVLGGLLIGGLLGEWWKIEDRLKDLGAFLEARFAGGSRAGRATGSSDLAQDASVSMLNEVEAHSTIDQHQPRRAQNAPASALSEVEAPSSPDLHGSRFVRGFLTASILYLIGPMAILGSINDGLSGDYSLLAIKSVLDGFASLAFASSLGVGVLFSSLPILVYQGGISLLAAQARALISEPMMTEMTATGGILLIGIAISSLLELKPIRVGSFLPALFIAPLLVAILTALGIL